MAENYAVAEPGDRGRDERRGARPRAVFVAHGMGQQVPFATLDDLARGICETSGATTTKATARTVRAGCDSLQRLELELERDGVPLRPIHVFEAYWAPLTEGAVGLWQVVRFLLGAGFNGVRAGDWLHRFMFGKHRRFQIPKRDIIELVSVVIVIVALIVIGLVIGTVGVARLTFRESAFFKDEMVRDLSAVFEFLLAVLILLVLAAIALIVAAGKLMTAPDRADPRQLLPSWRNRVAQGLRLLTIPIAGLISLVLIVVAYALIPLAIVFNVRPPFAGSGCADCPWRDTMSWRASIDVALRRSYTALHDFCRIETAL